MARVKCLKCDASMRRDKSLIIIGKNRYRFYTCPACGRTRSIKAGEAYESPSARRMRLGREKRLVDRWAKKGGII